MFRSISSCRKRLVATALVLALSLAAMTTVAGHDIPDRVVIQAFVKPEGEQLHLLVRLPLILLLNLDLPKHGRGYLDLAHIDAPLQEAAATAADEILLFENDQRLAFESASTRISLASDKSFVNYAEALAHLRGPKLPVETLVFWNQGFLDAHLQYPITSDRSDFSLQVLVAPGLGDRLETVVRFLPPEGQIRAYRLVENQDRVVLDPRWHQAGWTFVKSGFGHILEGIDHLLFLFCLVIPLRRFRNLVIVVTSFTVAHSMTLIASAYGLAPPGTWFPPLVETLIAASIVYMAIENMVKVNLTRRWFITFAFGLVHGFGFSFALQDSLQFAGSHLLLSLLSFNVGVELGQILVILFLVPAVAFFFRYVLAERVGTILLSVMAAHTAWHWMTERGAELANQTIPVPDVAAIAMLAAGMLVVALISGALWMLAERWRRAAGEVASAEERLPDAL